MAKFTPDPKPSPKAEPHEVYATIDPPRAKLPPKETKPTPGDPSETKTYRDLVDPKSHLSRQPDIPERYLTGGATAEERDAWLEAERPDLLPWVGVTSTEAHQDWVKADKAAKAKAEAEKAARAAEKAEKEPATKADPWPAPPAPKNMPRYPGDDDMMREDDCPPDEK